MKLKPTFLFAATAVLIILSGVLTKSKTIDINFHDTYFIISYLNIAILFSLLTGLFAMIYFGLEKINRPIKLQTGFFHFGLLITALLVFIVSINALTTTNFNASNINGLSALMSIGIILLLTSTIIFFYGIIKAIIKSL